MQAVYLFSGPLGVGKTTVTREMVQSLKNAKLIEGDIFFNGEYKRDDLSWEQRLELTWKKIANFTKMYLEKHKDVVIDFVVEDELPWFCTQVAEYKPVVKYIVLMADKETLVKRLTERDEIKYLGRSLELLEKLGTEEKHKKYILNTTDKSVSDIVHTIMASSQFVVTAVS